MHRAPLPAGLGEALAEGLDQAQALVRNDQPHPGQAARFQVPQEVPPALGVLLGAFADAQDLAMPLGVDADGHQHGDGADLAAPAPLQPDAVEVDVGILPG
jgi:hypothetical protein